MYFNSSKIVYRNGKAYYINDDSDGPGVLVIMFLMVVGGIVTAVQSAYIWMLAHYGLMACVSIIGLITWIGWAKINHELGELTKFRNLMKGFIVMVLICLCFRIAFIGFAQSFKSFKGSSLKTAMQGKWFSLDNHLELTITAQSFELKNRLNDARMSAKYTLRDAESEIAIDCRGKLYEKDNAGKLKIDSFKQTYFCRFQGDTLLLAYAGSNEYLLYVKR